MTQNHPPKKQKKNNNSRFTTLVCLQPEPGSAGDVIESQPAQQVHLAYAVWVFVSKRGHFPDGL